MTDKGIRPYMCCECCLTYPMHPDQHEVNCPTCDNPVADRLRAERGELAAKLAHTVSLPITDPED